MVSSTLIPKTKLLGINIYTLVYILHVVHCNLIICGTIIAKVKISLCFIDYYKRFYFFFISDNYGFSKLNSCWWEPALFEWWSWSLDSHKKMYVRICAGIKTARRKAASTKWFIRVKEHSKSGKGSWRWNWPGPRLFGDWIFAASVWAGRSCDVQWSLMQVPSNPLGDPSSI